MCPFFLNKQNSEHKMLCIVPVISMSTNSEVISMLTLISTILQYKQSGRRENMNIAFLENIALEKQSCSIFDNM